MPDLSRPLHKKEIFHKTPSLHDNAFNHKNKQDVFVKHDCLCNGHFFPKM